MDVILAGKTAVIESIEQDYDGGYHVAVVVEDDPGRDLGLLRQPGHRFFYAPEEIELCAEPSILIAGIGNIFLGDDGFGVAVAQRLRSRELPPGVRVVDFGIRALDLAYALIAAPDVTILIDACPRGEAPGSLFVIEPEIATEDAAPPPLEAHAMDPMLVIKMAMAMGGRLKRILLLGCEPATIGPEEGQLGLSPQVDAVIDDAITLALTLVRRIREGDWPDGRRQHTA
jgi:hydrogenase maturation protease